uniref:Uncharacterized protein n=1 Tax=Amphimedon queenslandica TaxID=400682 RepID=A0A1X7V486_AMPQE
MNNEYSCVCTSSGMIIALLINDHCVVKLDCMSHMISTYTFMQGSPDGSGTCILTYNNDNILRLYNLPNELYSSSFPDHIQPETDPVVYAREGNNACKAKVGGFTIGCDDDEELFQGSCYKKCSLLANKDFPLRTAMNTCARNGCTSSQEYDAGLCYPKCKEYYIGVATVCWGYCSKFCGKDYTDMGLYCYRWWPPHSCYKPRYDRGVGSLPYQPWTDGIGCTGFGVNDEGGCPLEDISDKLPSGYECNNQ